jgi:hypothetical protein
MLLVCNICQGPGSASTSFILLPTVQIKLRYVFLFNRYRGTVFGAEASTLLCGLLRGPNVSSKAREPELVRLAINVDASYTTDDGTFMVTDNC